MVSNSAASQAISESSIHRYEALLRASNAIATCRDGQAVIQRFADELRKFVKFDYILITVVDNGSGEVRWRAFQAFGAEDKVDLPVFQPYESPSGWAYETQQPIVIP